MKPTPATTEEVSHEQLKREKFHLRDGVWTMLERSYGRNAATAVRVAFDVIFAPDGQPWPSCWSPEHWMSLPAGHRWDILTSARRWDAGPYPVAAAPFRAGNRPLLVLCPDCGGKVQARPVNWFSGQQTRLPGSCESRHRNPYANKGGSNTNATRAARAVAAALPIVAASDTVRLVGPPPPTTTRHKARLRCLVHGEEHETLLSSVLRTLRLRPWCSGLVCCGSRRQPPGNGKVEGMAEMGAAALGPEGLRATTRKMHEALGPEGQRAAARLGGLATGGRDDIFLRAQGLGRPLNGPCSYYLTTVPGHPDLVKPGIASDCERRARQPDYCGGKDFHAEWVRPTRDEAAAIESIRLRATQHLAEMPPELEGKNGAWEIRRLSLEAEIAEVELLVDALNEGMSPWELALSFMSDLTSAERAILRGAMS